MKLSRFRGMTRALERDIAAERAATMFRKGATKEEVIEALGMSDTAIRKLAAEFGFRYPGVTNKHWPAADHPGDAGRTVTAYDNWARAVAGSRATLEANQL